jgi:hypothetical protein
MQEIRGATAVMASAAVVLAGFLATAAYAATPNVPQAALDAIGTRASQMGSVASMDAVATSVGAAQDALNASAAASVSMRRIDLVVVHGQFLDSLAKVPPRAQLPSGSVAAYTVDRSTGEVGLTYLGNSAPSLASLGAVEHITPVSGTASASRAGRHARIARRRRSRAKTASWGNNCKYAEEHHCYAVAEWYMSAAGEEVRGTESEQKTTAMNVPGSASGYFVTNEEWLSFPSKPNYWLEIGQQAGEFKGCCTLWWFYAWSNAGGYHQRVTAAEGVWEVSANSWNNYGIQSAGSGTWCYYVGPTWEQKIACEAGFPNTSKLLEDGMEVATETKPSVAGSVVANATWMNGSIHTWNFASNYAETYAGAPAPGLCVSQYPPVNFPGNINYGTC